MRKKTGKRESSLIQIKGNHCILTHARHARSTWERFKGLLGVTPREHTYALVFHLEKEGKINASIHMLFMQMPIDVLFLDEKGEPIPGDVMLAFLATHRLAVHQNGKVIWSPNASWAVRDAIGARVERAI